MSSSMPVGLEGQAWSMVCSWRQGRPGWFSGLGD